MNLTTLSDDDLVAELISATADLTTYRTPLLTLERLKKSKQEILRRLSVNPRLQAAVTPDPDSPPLPRN